MSHLILVSHVLISMFLVDFDILSTVQKPHSVDGVIFIPSLNLTSIYWLVAKGSVLLRIGEL